MNRCLPDLILGTLLATGIVQPASAADGPPSANVPANKAAAPDEAWWTGPIAASSADTLPHGHLLLEPYVYDVRTRGGDYLGSLTYILYGLTDHLTVGVIPTFGSARSRGAPAGRRFAANDLTLQAQLRLHRASAGELFPTLAVLVQRGVPVGRYDRLGDDTDLGIGGGVASTTLGINAHRVDRLPSGRALRTRINVARTLPSTTRARDVSIFGTPSGFSGTARVGATATADLSIEYSVTRRVALATDLIARWTRPGLVAGKVDTPGGVVSFTSTLPGSRSLSVAPAVEYSWTSSRGVLLGFRWTAADRGRAGSITPVIAFNAVL